MNELIPLETLKAIDVYTGDALNKLIKKVEDEVANLRPDISTEKGRGEIRTMAHQIARSKTGLDALGKELTEEAREKINTTNADRKRMRDRFDELKEEVRAPLTEWENIEKDRIAEHEQFLIDLGNLKEFSTLSPTLEDIKERIDDLGVFSDRDWQEFKEKADARYKFVEGTLNNLFTQIEGQNKKDAELEKLRDEAAKREAKERDERIATEAAKKAKLEAEEKAKREKQEIQNQKEAAEKAAAKAKQDVQDAKKQAKDLATKVAREKKEAAIKAKRQADEAAQLERDRIAKKQKAEADAIAKREADTEHRRKINKQIMSDIIKASSVNEEQSKKILMALVKRQIRNVQVNY